MSATAWAFYTQAKKKIGNGTINLGSGVFRLRLLKSTSNASLPGLLLAGSLTNELGTANGYTIGGKSLPTPMWTVSGVNIKFDCATDPVWTASGAGMTSIMYGTINSSAGGLNMMFWSKLSTGIITVATGNTLTVQMASTGIFTLS